MTLPVSEVFTSLQGEGPRAGRAVTFIRLGGCNLSCSWCDTPYTWNGKLYDLRKELTPMSVDQIINQIPGGINEVVITGGEPLLHQDSDDWRELMKALKGSMRFICIETNGTIAPNPTTQTYVGHYSISPKLANAGEHRGNQNPKMADWPTILRGRNAILKFVVENEMDVKHAADMAVDMGWPTDAVWVMPEGTTTEELLKKWPEIAEAAVNERVNGTFRLHVLAWGDTRGT